MVKSENLLCEPTKMHAAKNVYSFFMKQESYCILVWNGQNPNNVNVYAWDRKKSTDQKFSAKTMKSAERKVIMIYDSHNIFETRHVWSTAPKHELNFYHCKHYTELVSCIFTILWMLHG